MNRITLFLLAMLVWLASPAAQAQKLNYPKTAQVKQIDNYFGTDVADPYRWLEVSDSAAVKDWIKEQNKVTFDYLAQIPFRENLKQRLTQIWNYPKIGAPFKRGDYYYFYKNDGLQNQSILYRQKTLGGEAEVFLDPNTLSKEGVVALGNVSFSRDAQYCAYTIAKGGSDWQEIYIMKTETKELLNEKVEWVKFSGISWYKDGFYYSAYDAPKEGKALEAKNEFHKVYYHQLNTDPKSDVLIYEDKEHALRNFGAGVSEDQQYLFLSMSEGTSGDEIYFKRTDNPNAEFKPLVTGFNTETNVVDTDGNFIYLLTNADAPNYRLVRVNADNPDRAQWETVIPESKNVISNVSAVGGFFVVSYLKDAASQVLVFTTDGTLKHEVKFPTIGNATGFGGRKEDKILFYTFTSYTYPPVIFQYDIASNASTLYYQTELDFKSDDYETRQVFYPSKDGTKIPMFITLKKGASLDGNNPTYLYAYGGFNISQRPGFNPAMIPFLEKGGIYAVANLRGGSEYGEEWHKAGMLFNKQNVFDDFIAAGEYLIREKYTSSSKLAIAGGSNGGLLVGACMTQRPDLFQVAIPAVGVMDMLRFHKFTIGWAWAVEYGSSEKSEADFKNLYGYSPLHNIKAGVKYPATLVKTADHDDRVVPAHSFKFISTLQEKHVGDNPVVIRIDEKAGHGAGKPTAKLIEEWADTWAFVFYNMGLNPF